MNIRENEAVELRCVVHDAKPKATIVWFRENTEFITGKFLGSIHIQILIDSRSNVNEHNI